MNMLNASELANSAEKASDFLKSIANVQRLRILCAVMDGELSVGDIAQAVDASQSVVSQHLALMRREGIVQPRRDGQSIYYRIGDKNVIVIFKTLGGIFCREAGSQ